MNPMENQLNLKPPRKEVRHHWGIHVSEADDQMLAALQERMFREGKIKQNTKYALVRLALNIVIAAATKRAQAAPVPPVPLPAQPSPAPSTVDATLQMMRNVATDKLRAERDAAAARYKTLETQLQSLATQPGGIRQ